LTEKILVLGGYGNFGRLICGRLAELQHMELIVAGRNREKADSFIESLQRQGASCKLSTLVLDIFSETFAEALLDLKPSIVIHTSGPFQGQDYRIPVACMDAGCHYIDLADDRRFVCDFHRLDARAGNTGSVAISGASSVPGLSSVVIDNYATEFEQIEEIEYSITPGSNVEIGEATLRGILSYTGHAFKGWDNGGTVDLFGWGDIRRRDFGKGLGVRWLANVDIPDLELFPERYPGIKTVRFQAGHELAGAHLAMAFMGLLTRLHLVNRWDSHSGWIYNTGQKLKALGSDTGGMCIRLTGRNKAGNRHALIWKLVAPNGTGPHIPTLSAIILAGKILNRELTKPMAAPCLGMYSLDEFSRMADRLGIYQEVERTDG
jgi:saccharopine dehydrogenase-like NADP-dependent oxidoreductase